MALAALRLGLWVLRLVPCPPCQGDPKICVRFVKYCAFGHSLTTSRREIADSVGLARSTVSEYSYRSDVACLSRPLPSELSDEDLERLLFPDEHSIVGELIY